MAKHYISMIREGAAGTRTRCCCARAFCRMKKLRYFGGSLDTSSCIVHSIDSPVTSAGGGNGFVDAVVHSCTFGLEYLDRAISMSCPVGLGAGPFVLPAPGPDFWSSTGWSSCDSFDRTDLAHSGEVWTNSGWIANTADVGSSCRTSLIGMSSLTSFTDDEQSLALADF